MFDDSATRSAAHGDYVDFFQAGAAASGAFHCAECGYGVTVHATLPRCPMCGGTTWEAAPVRPLVRNQLH